MRILLVITLFFHALYSSALEVTPEQREFVNELTTATKADDKEWISEFIAYPLSVSLVNGDRILLETEADFIENYDVIFNANVKEAFLQQEMSELFINWQGLMIGRGHVWITEVILEDCVIKQWIIGINPTAPPMIKQTGE